MYLANRNLSTLAKLAKVIFGLEGSQIGVVVSTVKHVDSAFSTTSLLSCPERCEFVTVIKRVG